MDTPKRMTTPQLYCWTVYCWLKRDKSESGLFDNHELVLNPDDDTDFVPTFGVPYVTFWPPDENGRLHPEAGVDLQFCEDVIYTDGARFDYHEHSPEDICKFLAKKWGFTSKNYDPEEPPPGLEIG